jgi:hypothetical protein
MTTYPLSLHLQNYKATAKAYLCDIRDLFGFECSSVWNYDDCVAFNTDFCKWFSMPEPCYYYGCLEDSRDRCAKEYKEFAQSEKTPVTGSQQSTLTWKDHGNYVGDIKNGLPHGYGTFTWNSGSKYVGEFKDGKKHGQGTYTFADGGTFIGEYKNRKPWNGVHYDKDGNKSDIYADGVRQ